MAQPPPDDSSAIDSADEPKPTGYGLLAGRMWSWGTNLLATALILLLAVTFGRQALELWYADSATPDVASSFGSSTGDDALGDPAAVHSLAFGELEMAFQSSTLQGDKAAAFAELRRLTRAVLSKNEYADRLSGPAEERLLAGLRNVQPIEEEPGRWQIFQRDGPLLMVVGVAPLAAGAGSPPPREVAGSNRRVVSWGLAAPAAPGWWTLMTCVPGDPAIGGTSKRFVPRMPEGCRRTVSLATADGAALIGFHGRGDPWLWAKFFDDEFAVADWTSQTDWRTGGGAWHASYIDGQSSRADVQLSVLGDAAIYGTITITPIANASATP